MPPDVIAAFEREFIEYLEENHILALADDLLTMSARLKSAAKRFWCIGCHETSKPPVWVDGDSPSTEKAAKTAAAKRFQDELIQLINDEAIMELACDPPSMKIRLKKMADHFRNCGRKEGEQSTHIVMDDEGWIYSPSFPVAYKETEPQNI